MRIQMDRRVIAVMGLLVLEGLSLSFAFTIIICEDNGRTEDIWLVQNTQSPEISGPLSEYGSETSPKAVTDNETSHKPFETPGVSNVSKITLKTIAHNQSTVLVLSPSGKTGLLQILNWNNSESKTGALTVEQRNLAEEIALADARVRNIIGTGMYNIGIQPLNNIQVKNSEEIPPNGNAASIVFTTFNTTTTLNETTFFVHVDLANKKVIRVSPLFPPDTDEY
jgi:hypothetical protein